MPDTKVRSKVVADEVFRLGDNDVVMRLGCWDVLTDAAKVEGFDDVAEWILYSALTRAMIRAMAEKDDELADKLGMAMNERWPITTAA